VLIEPGDDVIVDDGGGVVGHVRRVTLREITIYVETVGDLTLPRDLVLSVKNNHVFLQCRKLPLRVRAALGHLHGETFADEP